MKWGYNREKWKRALYSLIGKCRFLLVFYLLFLSSLSLLLRICNVTHLLPPSQMNSRPCLFSGVLWAFGDITVLCFNNPACHNQSKSHQTECKVTVRRREPGACLQLSGSCPKQSAKLSRVSFHLITSPSLSDVCLSV